MQGLANVVVTKALKTFARLPPARRKYTEKALQDTVKSFEDADPMPSFGVPAQATAARSDDTPIATSVIKIAQDPTTAEVEMTNLEKGFVAEKQGTSLDGHTPKAKPPARPLQQPSQHSSTSVPVRGAFAWHARAKALVLNIDELSTEIMNLPVDSELKKFFEGVPPTDGKAGGKLVLLPAAADGSMASRKEPIMDLSPFAASFSPEWCVWFQNLNELARAHVEAAIVDLVCAQKEQEEAADRIDTTTFFILEMLTGFVVLVDYM